MSEELRALYADIRPEVARFTPPFKTLFFCGGVMADAGRALSLRDYLCRTRNARFHARIIRAEEATKLFKRTSYDDLISFEEDIARIASVVMVIAESPGSLAELGAFAVNDTIRESLRLIVQDEYEEAESFIRYGPVEKVMLENEDRVAFYPWKITGGGRFLARSAAPHYKAMKAFIGGHVDAAPASRLFGQAYEVQRYFVIYWALYLAYAASFNVILQTVKVIYPAITQSELRDALFCLTVLGWVRRKIYSNKEYYFSVGAEDPIEYRFPRGGGYRPIVERRMEVHRQVSALEAVPRHVQKLVAAARVAQ